MVVFYDPPKCWHAAKMLHSTAIKKTSTYVHISMKASNPIVVVVMMTTNLQVMKLLEQLSNHVMFGKNM
jgi:hypothetical protein